MSSFKKLTWGRGKREIKKNWQMQLKKDDK
jgi:hypothetical protein